MNGLVAISDQVCNKWLVSTHLSVNNSPVQLIFNQSAREPCLQRQQILTTRAPPSYANDPQDAQEVWIIIIINITITIIVITCSMQMTPGLPKMFGS